MVDFAADGNTCLMLSSLGRETTALLRVDLQVRIAFVTFPD